MSYQWSKTLDNISYNMYVPKNHVSPVTMQVFAIYHNDEACMEIFMMNRYDQLPYSRSKYTLEADSAYRKLDNSCGKVAFGLCYS